MSDNNLPPHLEAGAMVPVCNDDGKVIRLIRKADLYHMERQIAAAERLYEAVKQHSESTDVPDYLDNASSDYANAKGEK